MFTNEGKFWRGLLSYRYMSASTFNRIELDKNYTYCWTLFILSKTFKEWGFNTNNGWIVHSKYFENKKSV